MSDLKRRKISHESRPKKKVKADKLAPQPSATEDPESESDDAEEQSATANAPIDDDEEKPEIEEKKTFADLVRLLIDVAISNG